VSSEVSAMLERALELSRDLLAAAEHGQTPEAVKIDAERRLLLKSARASTKTFDANQRMLLREIVRLNDQSIGSMEHHRRIMGRRLDVAAVGRRAVNAYATTRLMR
jgi:hypothetical protein